MFVHMHYFLQEYDLSLGLTRVDFEVKYVGIWIYERLL